jgi:hypothetical protein
MINKTKYPALMVKLSVIGSRSKERMLPVIFSDNYISLMPGEKRIVTMELQDADTRGEQAEVVVTGYPGE